MTRLERKQMELERLQKLRLKAVQHGDLLWITKNEPKITALKDEITKMRYNNNARLSEVLKEYGDDVKDRVYKCLLKISLAADYVNECSEQTKDVLREINLKDFMMRADVDEIRRLSQKVASIVLIPQQELLTDMMVDNAEFIDACDEAADKYLNEKLKL